MLTHMMTHKQHYPPVNMYMHKSHNTDTVVPTNKKVPPLEGVHYTKIGDMSTLKHEIISSKFYDFLLKTYRKEKTAMDHKNFYNQINMCLNAVTGL